MLDSLTKEDYIKLENILNERLSYIISNKRNLFNFAVLDEIEIEIKDMIKTSNSLVFKTEYNNIYDIIDNFDNNIEYYINKRLQEIGD